MIVDAVRLPIDVERGVKGGPMFNTIVLKTDGGETYTNQNWAYPLYKGQIGYGIQSRENMDEVISFFYARRGRYRGFLFRDWSDYTLTNVTLGTGDGVEDDFPLVKRYADTVLPFVRPIKYAIESTLLVYKNGVLSPDSDWSLLSDGTIRFGALAIPGAGVVVTATCEFNIAVHFMSDMLELDMETYNAGSIPNIQIMEIRD